MKKALQTVRLSTRVLPLTIKLMQYWNFDKMETSNQPSEEEIQQSVSVDWQQGNTIGNCMVEMYNRGLWTDVDFRCKDHEEGETIKAHKIVLSARSPVFQAMFFGPCADGKKEVVLENVEKDIFDLFLRYLYSDSVSLTEETASAVLEMAHYYRVSSLVQYCADFLSTVTTIDNVCEILTLAMFYDVTSLKETCGSFIDKHAESVLNSKGFLDLSVDCLTYILKGDTFYAKENEIFIKAEKWSTKKILEKGLEKNGSNNRKTLGESFYYLRLPTLDSKSLMECTRKKGYFQLEEHEDIIDYINGIPETAVSSNSCVHRVPTNETLLLHQHVCEQLLTNPLEEIATSFDLSVNKDVALTNIFLTNIKPLFVYDETMYSFKDSVVNDIENYSQKTIFDVYCETHGKVIAFQQSSRYKHLTAWQTEDLPGNVSQVIVGSMSIESLDFKHTFNLLSSDLPNASVCLGQPLLLKKENSPFKVKLTMESRNREKIKFRTKVCKINTPVRNATGHLHVSNISGHFAAIGSISFKNFSNRDHGNCSSSTRDC